MTMRSIAAGLLAFTLALTLAGTASAAEEIPTQIAGAGEPSEYPDPICTTCKIKTVRSSRASSHEAFVTLVYLDTTPFAGELMVTVWLADGTDDVVVVPDVALAYGDERWIELAACEGWGWDEVRAVEVAFLPAN